MELLRERKAAREKEREKERAESQEQNAANTSKAAESSGAAAVTAESAADKVWLVINSKEVSAVTWFFILSVLLWSGTQI